LSIYLKKVSYTEGSSKLKAECGFLNLFSRKPLKIRRKYK